jgi:two-component system, OmpR family, phosphate regulon sensor histidine kinase PhoR
MWRSRMFWRLFAWQALVLLAVVGLLGMMIYQRVERQHLQHLEDDLRARARLLGELVRSQAGRPPADLQERVRALRRDHKLDTRLTVIDAKGTVLADSDKDPDRMGPHGNRPEVRQAHAGRGFGSATRFSDTLGTSLRYVALYLDDLPGRGPVYVRVAVPVEDVAEELAVLRRLIWSAAGLTALGAMGLAFWLAQRITRPLQELTEGAERIAAGGFGHKVYAGGRDEVTTLARTFNHMSERLAEQFTQLDEERQQLRAILSGMVEGVVALDAGQRVLFANDRAVQLLELQGQPVVGRKLWEVSRQRGLQKVVRRALAEVDTCQEEITFSAQPARNLTVHAARLSGSPARGAVLVLHDTTELRRLERLRQEFVANVSHELKTPLSVIQACVETLLDGAADDPNHRGPFLEQIADQSSRLHSLILDLLSLASIEAGTEAFTFEAVPLAPAVAACLGRHRARAEARGQTLEAVPPSPDRETGGQGDKGTRGAEERPGADGARGPSPCLPVSLSPCLDVTAWADEDAVRQIIDNLVDNAVKYTPAGGQIRVHWRAEGNEVVLEVADTGIGIPERDLPRIFERFYRVDKARSRALGGTGLGLSIVKHLVGALHGTVAATSQVGQGTTFQVRLPRSDDKVTR